MGVLRVLTKLLQMWFMATESKTLTEQPIRKERALASMREFQLAEGEDKLLRTDQVEATWPPPSS